MNEKPATAQFREVTADGGKKALEVYCAVYTMHNGEDVFIGAPTMEKLETAWRRLTASPQFDRQLTNHAWLMKAGK